MVFNNHLLILHKIMSGENPLSISLNFSEFWVQIHDLPLGLMTETMAFQFGNFLGLFLEYDTLIPMLGIQQFMIIRVRLDVSLPLKREKMIQIGKERVVYARFQYEKPSLFCFICEKLGHGESFFPLRIKMVPSIIFFGWDISLRATARRKTTAVSQWLGRLMAQSVNWWKRKGGILGVIRGIEERLGGIWDG